jgi:hypothetical protein
LDNACRNSSVIRAWLEGIPAVSWTGNLRTDGKSLWSYALRIGYAGTVFDYTARSGYFQSQTTSCHVGLAFRFSHYRRSAALVSPSVLDDLDNDILGAL